MRGKLALFTLFSLTACTGHLDREIARLDQEISVREKHIAGLAEKFHSRPGADFEVKVGAEPILDVLREIDETPSLKRTIVVRSIDRSGRLAEAWTKCWPFSRKMGIYLSLAHDNALYSIFHMGRTNPKWDETKGLEFDFDVKGAGGALIAIGAKYCIGSGNIGAVPVAAVMPPLQQTRGRLFLSPKAEGIAYELRLDRAPYFVLGACALGLCAGAPVRMDNKLQDGLISNPIGNEGEVQLSKLGKARKYTLDFRFNEAAIVPGGLSLSGPSDVQWADSLAVSQSQALNMALSDDLVVIRAENFEPKLDSQSLSSRSQTQADASTPDTEEVSVETKTMN